MELALATLAEGDRDPNPEDPRSAYGLDGGNEPQSYASDTAIEMHIANTLRNHGIPASSQGKVFDPVPGHWMITQDSSIMAPHREYNYCQIEITTPIFYFTEQSIAQVRKVCQILAGTYRININQSCGIHVHSGDETLGFSADTLRNLSAFLWTFETQLATIHPKHRLKNMLQSGNIGELSVLGLGLVGDRLRRPGLEMILSTETGNEAVGLLQPPEPEKKRLAYAFANVELPYVHPEKRTVEFRQHEGTLDADELISWLRVCNGIIEYARNEPREAMEKFCRDNVDRDVSLLDVLVQLRLHSEALYYTLRVAQNRVEPKAGEFIPPEKMVHPNWRVNDESSNDGSKAEFSGSSAKSSNREHESDLEDDSDSIISAKSKLSRFGINLDESSSSNSGHEISFEESTSSEDELSKE